MESSQIEHPLPQQKLFAPFVANTFQTKGDKGVYLRSVTYNEKHNLIILCSRDSSMQFFNATTLLPSEEFKTEQLDSHVLITSFCPETETYLLGCDDGEIYTYNLPNKILNKVDTISQRHIPALTFLHSKYYAFSASRSGRLCIENLENRRDTLIFRVDSLYPRDLYYLAKRKLLFLSIASGSIQIYRTDRLPKLPVISSVRGFSDSQIGVRKTLGITINGKELIVTAGWDCPVRIWHIYKGRMKLLRVIRMGERAYDMVYLEDYKMLATTHNSLFMRFLRLPSGKLESKVELEIKHYLGMFLMEDKNALGTASIKDNKMSIIKLCR